MDPVHLFLANVWFGLIGLILMLYVILDGFTLGVGILSLAERDDHHLGLMMYSLSGVWDANESWLIVFGGALFGAFPIVYGVVLHALYIPVTVMILAMIFRSIAFDYRERAERKRGWNRAFGLGSLIAASAQGVSIGAVLAGMPVKDSRFVGGIWDWVSPFSAAVALGVVFGYALLGAAWLIIKTDGPLQEREYRFARISGWLTVSAGIAVSVWTPLRFDYVEERWFSWPNILYLAPLPLLALWSFIKLHHALSNRHEIAPFVWSVAIFFTSFLGLAISLYPFLVPPSITLESASSSITLAFMMVGIGLLIPVMIVYNGYQYLVFRGKVKYGEQHY